MAKNIKIYTTPTCPYCQMLKSFLKSKNIEFEEIDVLKNPQKAKEIFEKTNQMGVPVVDIDGKIIIGFDKEAISKELGI
ncbi:MAG: glutaredoxin family protein [Endomicrobiia bacterium]